MIKKNRKKYKKPDKKDKATVYPYNDNKQFDIVTRKYPKNTKISEWRRIDGNKMKNIITGAEKEFKKKSIRKSSSVCGELRVAYRTLKNNFKGKEYEYIFVFEFIVEVMDINELNKELKSIIEKLKRRFKEIIFIRVLLYEEKDQPIIHFWIKKADETQIDITVAELEKLWGNGTAEIIKVTKYNVERLARYYSNEYINKELYPTGIKVWSTSTNIDKIEPIEDIDHEQADDLVKDCNLTYGKSISFEDSTTGEEIQHITYESFYRPDNIKKLIKLPAGTKYKGNFVRAYKQRQKEKVDKTFAEIEKLIAEKDCWLTVERLDIDLCKITIKRTGKEFNTLDTRQTLMLIRYLVNKRKNNNKNRRNL